MNLGIENETLEFKKSAAELDKAMHNIASMLNKHGHGTLYFGVSPNGEVTGQRVSEESLNDIAKKISETIRPVIYPRIQEVELDGVSVIKVDFSGEEKPYSANGRYYKRVFDRTEEMTPFELRSAFSSSDVMSLWEDHITPFGLEAVDHETVRIYYQRAISCGRIEEMAQYDEGSLLGALGLMVDGYLTNAGYYLFSSRKPVVLKTAVFVTDERLSFSDINRFEGNIYSLMDKAYRYVKEHMNWRVERGDGTARIEVPEVPIDAIREIIVNAFAHADYRGATEHEIDITPTMIEIYNPGEFPENLSPEMFAKNHIKSMPRNRVILNTLYKSKDVEIFGSGFRKTYSLCERAGIRCRHSSSNCGFSFFFLRPDVGRGKSSLGMEKLSPIERAIINGLKLNPRKNRLEISVEVGKSTRTVQRILNAMVIDGKLMRVGSDKSGHWEVSPEYKWALEVFEE